MIIHFLDQLIIPKKFLLSHFFYLLFLHNWRWVIRLFGILLGFLNIDVEPKLFSECILVRSVGEAHEARKLSHFIRSNELNLNIDFVT